MAGEDPEERIAELERQLLERGHDRAAKPRPSRTQHSFVATAPRVNWKLAAFLVYGGMFGVVGLLMVLSAVHVNTGPAGEWLHWLVIGGYLVVGAGLARSRAVRSFFSPKVTIVVSGDGIDVKRGSKTRSFPLAGATLGPWATQQVLMGSALHLRKGWHRYAIGGQDFVPGGLQHLAARGARLDAKPVWSVNAYMPASNFGALLASVYR